MTETCAYSTAGIFAREIFCQRQVCCIGYKFLPDLISPSMQVGVMEVVGRAYMTSRSLRTQGVEAELPTYECRHGHWPSS